MYFVPLVTQKSVLLSSDNTFPKFLKNSDNKYQLIWSESLFENQPTSKFSTF